MPSDTSSTKPLLRRSFLLALVIGLLIGFSLAAHRVSRESDPYGLAIFVFPILTGYFGLIATGLAWLPLLAVSRWLQPTGQRATWAVLVPAVAVFAFAAIPTGKFLHTRWAAARLEQRVKTALDRPVNSPDAWVHIDPHSLAVVGHVVQWLEKNPSATPEKLQEIATIFSENVHVATSLARAPRCSLSILETLWERIPSWRHKEDLRRFEDAIVSHAACSETLQWRILRETPYTETRDKVATCRGATNPDLHQEYLRLSAASDENHARAKAARDPLLSTALMSSLAIDKNAGVRAALATNPSLPVELLEVLNWDHELEVRRSVILQRNARPEWRRSFFEDASHAEASDYRYQAVQEDPAIPVATLTRLANDDSWDIRLAVANHPKTPRPTLEKLAQDSNAEVQSLARSRLK